MSEEQVAKSEQGKVESLPQLDSIHYSLFGTI
jgi:hypothetical protein